MLWKNEKDKVDHLHRNVTQSFAKLKDDINLLVSGIHNINQWIRYLHEEIRKQDGRLSHFAKHVQEYHLPQDELERILDSRSHMEHALTEIEKLNLRMEHFAGQHEPILKLMDSHHERISSLEGVSNRPAFKDKIMQKIAKNSKDYILGLISSTVQKYGKISGIQLRDIIVEEQGLCSKSSFYRLLLELETSNDIDVIQQGKEKYYLHKNKVSSKI